MQDGETAVDPVAPSGWLTHLATILVRPRDTMRRILDRRPDRMVIPLVLLAFISSSLSDFDRPTLERAVQKIAPVQLALMIAGILICVSLVMLLLFYVLSWIAVAIGRLLEGHGKPREVRSALAWGFAPMVWALLYRIPAACFLTAGERGRTKIQLGSDQQILIPQLFDLEGCGTALAFGIVELAVLVWYLIVASQTLAEAHRFSGWKGLATLIFSFVSPLILIVAAALTIAT